MAEARRCPQCERELGPEEPDGLCAQCTEADSEQDSAPSASQRATIKSRPRVTAPLPTELAEKFPQIEVIDLLGQGGMGVVYKARQLGLDRLVALKLLSPEVAQDASFAERFTREARAMAKLHHPNIVMIHDSGEIDGLYYFIMEYVDGPNLRQMLSAGHLTPEQALSIVPQVCEALEYAHGEGVVHRDIKPENILLDRKGRVKIADYGLAKLAAQTNGQSRLTRTQQMMGTPHYMAPEQTERPGEVDHRADIYATGVVFYEMLTGELPIGRFPLPSERAPCDTRLDEVVLRTLEKDPQRRFQRASELKTAVEAVISGAAVHASPSVAAGAIHSMSTPQAGMSAIGAPTRSTMHYVEVDFPRAYEAVRRPADWLHVFGIISLAMMLIPSIVFGIIALLGNGGPANHRSMITFGLLSGVALFIMHGSQRMKRLEKRRIAMLACILAVVPTTVCWFPLGIFGLWGMTVLNRREIIAAFDLKRQEIRASRVGGRFSRPR